MKQTIHKLITILLGLCVLVLLGCQQTRELDEQEPLKGERNVLRISTSAVNNGDDAENAIRTLRLFIFDKDGAMVFNKLFHTNEAQSGSTGSGYTYFLKTDDGGYQISELLKKMDIQVLMVANEMRSFDQPTYSIDAVRGAVLNFREMYRGSGNFTDIAITGLDNGADNKGFIPMFAETGIIAQGNWDAVMGKVLNLRLVRTLAKASITIKAQEINDPNFNVGDQLIISSASIGRMPAQSFLGYVASDLHVPFTLSSTVQFNNPITINHGSTTPLSTDKLTFYITEYLIDQTLVDNGQYAFLQVNGVLKRASGDEVQTIYRIPIGNGVKKLYGAGAVRPEDLSPSDLTVTRNNYYAFEAGLSTIGSIQALEINVSVKDWEATVDVNGSDDTPLLSVSTLLTKMTENKVRVHFWTNEQNVGIEALGTTAGAGFTVNDVFKNLSATPGSSTSNFVVIPSSSAQYHRFNGYMDFEFNDPTRYTATPQTYTVVLRAGQLTRTLTIEANPVVGRIVFQANGGRFAGNTDKLVKELRLSEVGMSQKLVGSILTVDDPRAGLTPPNGKTLIGWSYFINGASIATPLPNDQLSVTMSGYGTTLYALWL